MITIRKTIPHDNNNNSSCNCSSNIHKLFNETNISVPYDMQVIPSQSNTTTKDCVCDNGISQILQKQINYTLDTIVNAIDTFDNDILIKIALNSSTLLFDIITLIPDKENLIHITVMKILKKIYLNINNITTVVLYGNESIVSLIFNLFTKL